MVHGAPDWKHTSGRKTTFQLRDMGEAAVRLGSIVNFDRVGDVVWYDDFEASTLKWHVGGNGAGYSVELSNESAKSGSQSLKLVTGSTDARSVDIVRSSAQPVLSNWGMQYSFAIGANIASIDTTMITYLPGKYLEGEIRYRPQDNILQYLDTDANWITFATGVDLFEHDFTYHTLKLVVDLEHAEYIRCRVNEKTYDLAGIAMRVVATSFTPGLVYGITVCSATEENNYVYVDDVVITQNET